MRVLIVDDDRHVLEGLKMLIPWETMGVDELDLADNGVEAMELYRASIPDLLITDMYMPRMNGIELIEQIRQTNMRIPIIILSGYDDFAYTQKAIQYDVTRYILKPSYPDEICREIREVIEELIHTRKQHDLLRDMGQKLDQSVPILREQLLYQMVTMGIRKHELDDDKLAFYQLAHEVKQSALVMSMQIYRTEPHPSLTEKEWQLYKYAAANIVEEIVQQFGNGYLLRYMDDRLPILIFGASSEELVNRAKAIGKEMIRSINAFLSKDVNIGIGHVYDDTSKYPLSQKESKEVIEAGETEGINQLQYIEELFFSDSDWPKYPAEQITLLCEAMKLGDSAHIKSRWLDIERTFLRVPTTPLAYIQTMCSSIISSLAQQMMESGRILIEPKQMSEVLMDIHQQRTVDNLMKWMYGKIIYFHEMFESRARGADELPYINYIKKTVAEHYPHKISFAQIAKELNISRNYLSNLFKRETGVTFMNYLTAYRIDKAKEFLLKRQFMIYEVAEKVGYPEPAYFSRIFKNMTGLSPLEYVMKESQQET